MPVPVGVTCPVADLFTREETETLLRFFLYRMDATMADNLHTIYPVQSAKLQRLSALCWDQHRKEKGVTISTHKASPIKSY